MSRLPVSLWWLRSLLGESVMESWKRCSLPWSLMEGCIIDGSSPFRLWGCIGISKQRTALRLQGRLVSFAWRLMRDRAPLSRLIVTQKALQPLASALAHGCVRLGERRIWLGVDAARLHWRNALPTQSMELMTVNDWALTGFDGARNGFHCLENGSWSTAVLAVFKHSPSARGCMGAFCSVESSAQAHRKNDDLTRGWNWTIDDVKWSIGTLRAVLVTSDCFIELWPGHYWNCNFIFKFIKLASQLSRSSILGNMTR